MRFKFSRWLLLLCVISIASAARAQLAETEKPAKAQLTTAVKDKIENSLDTGDKDSLVTYSNQGHEIKRIALTADKIEDFDSLTEFAKRDPIATCEDPKSLKPPPQCVVCKNGHIICTRARFGEQVSADSDTKQHKQ